MLLVLLPNFDCSCLVIQESKAGLAVGKLRTHSNKEVSQAAKDLVKKWKNDVERLKATKSPAPKAAPPTKAAPPPAPAPAKPSTVARTADTDKVTLNFTPDKLRNALSKLIYNALACDATCGAWHARRMCDHTDKFPFVHFRQQHDRRESTRY